MTGTGIVIPTSFRRSLSCYWTWRKKYPEKVTSSTIQMNISLYMFLAQFLVKKIYFSSALGFYFFPAKTAYRDELKFQWSPQKLSPPHQAISNDLFLMSNTTEVIINLELQWASKVLRDLAVKFDFRASWTHFLSSPPKQCWYINFLDCTDHSTYGTLNWGARGTRDLTLDANKFEQILKSECALTLSQSWHMMKHQKFFIFSRGNLW